MKVIKTMLSLIGLNGKKEAKVNDMYKKSYQKIDTLNESIKEVNKLLYSKSVNYYILRSMGVIKPVRRLKGA